MNIKKMIILLLCAFFLGTQFFIVFVPYSFLWGKNDWKLKEKLFWPLLKYPMYAKGKEAGDHFIVNKIKVVLDNDKKIIADYEGIHINPYRLSDLLYSAKIVTDSVYTPTQFDSLNFNYLNYLIRQYISSDSKKVELWSKTFTITPDGIENIDVNWELTHSWEIKEDTTSINSISFYD
jgi:hypothetical protein